MNLRCAPTIIPIPFPLYPCKQGWKTSRHFFGFCGNHHNLFRQLRLSPGDRCTPFPNCAIFIEGVER
ncbi:ATP synthase gamma chain [Frankliniella fusca]|uniref:ATP synthase gamma chain n=1 Tax=Frankliniella fusca TaxID=407009 RepID=A0AAE1LQ48_9NEOP|nr:ATP synthase gamma chain [Frankliniella fusca]